MKRIIKRIIVGAITCGFVLAGFSPITAKADGTDPMDGWTIDGSKMISPAIEVTPEDGSVEYEAISMNLYLEREPTTGMMTIAVGSDPDSGDTEYTSLENYISEGEDHEEVTTSDGTILYKYSLYLPLNPVIDNYGENPFEDNAYLDKIVIIVNNQSDYDGTITYDNVRYVDAENLDDIDTEYNLISHFISLCFCIGQGNARPKHYAAFAIAICNPLLDIEVIEGYGPCTGMRYDEIIVLVDIDYLTSKQLAALLKELETDYLLFDNVHEKIYNKGSKFITDFVADLDEGDVSQKCLGILLGDYLQLNEDMLLNGDETAYTDFGAFADNLRALGVSDDTINKSIDPVTKALIDKVADLSKSNKEIEEEIAEVQEQLEEKQQAIDDKDKEIGEKSSEIDKLKKENEKNAADVAELEKKLKELEDEKAKTDAKIAEQEALVKKLQDEAAGKTDPGTNPSTDDKPSVTLKVGDTFVVGNGIYKITSADEVTLVSPKSDTLKSFTIEDTVKLMDGKDYKVTAIEANAFKENVKLTKVTIGANVAKIGKNAFNKCKKLKTITVNTELLTLKTVGSNAFKGIKKKATFKVPASMKKDYKKLFTKKGAKKPKIK